MPTEFTPVSALLGGAFIGLAAVLLLRLNGRIAGISGILNGALGGTPADRVWRIAFLLGLIGGAAIWFALDAGFAAPRSGFSSWLLAGGGVLVGAGTRLGSGCTSGHGVCGLARLSKRSLIAVVVFMGAGFLMVALLRHGIR
jgi:uncharacterized membrane protein YedE/YeeE